MVVLVIYYTISACWFLCRFYFILYAYISQSHPPTHLQFVHYVQVFWYQSDISTYRHLSLGNRRDLMYHNYLINRDCKLTKSADVSSIPGACYSLVAAVCDSVCISSKLAQWKADPELQIFGRYGRSS